MVTVTREQGEKLLRWSIFGLSIFMILYYLSALAIFTSFFNISSNLAFANPDFYLIWLFIYPYLALIIYWVLALAIIWSNKRLTMKRLLYFLVAILFGEYIVSYLVWQL